MIPAIFPIVPVCVAFFSLQSKGSLEVTESQSADAEPPPPPKPDLSRYTGLRTHLTLATNEGKRDLLERDSQLCAWVIVCIREIPSASLQNQAIELKT